MFNYHCKQNHTKSHLKKKRGYKKDWIQVSIDYWGFNTTFLGCFAQYLRSYQVLIISPRQQAPTAQTDSSSKLPAVSLIFLPTLLFFFSSLLRLNIYSTVFFSVSVSPLALSAFISTSLVLEWLIVECVATLILLSAEMGLPDGSVKNYNESLLDKSAAGVWLCRYPQRMQGEKNNFLWMHTAITVIWL